MDIIKGNLNFTFKKVIYLFSQYIISLLESSIYLYIKDLIEYKYFTVYKVCYVFGIINLFLSLITYSTVSFKDCNIESICTENKETNKYYFDNIKILFNSLNFEIIILLLVFIILFGILNFLIISIIQKYTVCHLFIFFLNKEQLLHLRIFEISHINILNVILLYIPYLIWLEFIELNFCGLEKNTQRNIQKRAYEDLLSGNNNNISDTYSTLIDEEEVEKENNNEIFELQQ